MFSFLNFENFFYLKNINFKIGNKKEVQYDVKN